VRRNLGFYGYIQSVCPQLVAVLAGDPSTYYTKLLRFVAR
jgi:hypothetical protein